MVTVLLPVYNAAEYLEVSIRSILQQTYKEIELLIINDGSFDASEAIIRGFTDPRIRYIANECNLGLIQTLNKGIALSSGKYVVRMDADDIALPNRIETQVKFMEEHQEVDISGTWFQFIENDWLVKHPPDFDSCKIKLLENTVLGHPTVIFRRQSIIEHQLVYASDALHAEDYLMWVDAVIKGLVIANLPEVLLQYRTHAKQVSTVYQEIQKNTVIQIQKYYANYYWQSMLHNNEHVYIALINRTIAEQATYLQAKKMVKQLLAYNRQQKNFNQPELHFFFNGHLYACARNVYINSPVLAYHFFFDQYFYKSTGLRTKLSVIRKWILS